jgi:hypothetical protein
MLFFFFTTCLPPCLLHAGQKTTIGETAWINIAEIPFSYLARIDTGAKTTSIHATNIKITNKSKLPAKNIGKEITFQTINRNGKSQLLTAIITRVSNIKNGKGTEQRYVIQLALSLKNVKKTVEVNLRDRSRMNYKLLIGRNFLSQDFLVDVDRKAIQSKQFHPKD